MLVFNKFLFFIFLFFFIFFIPKIDAAVVLKVKKKQALVHLQKLRTKKGSYFEVINFQGQKKGLIRIQKVGDQKAIGVLKFGRIKSKWSLKPISKKRAIVQLKRLRKKQAVAKLKRLRKKRAVAKLQRLRKKQAQIAQMRKSKTQTRRRLASKRKKLSQTELNQRKQMKRKLLERKRKKQMKSLQSYENSSDYILNDLPEETFYQSKEVLSYDDGSNPSEEDSKAPIGQEPSEDSVSEEYFAQETFKQNKVNEDSSDRDSMDSSGHKDIEERWSQNTIDEDSQVDFFDDGPYLKNVGSLIIGYTPRFQYNFMKITPKQSPPYSMKYFSFNPILLSLEFSLNAFLRNDLSLGFNKFWAKNENHYCGEKLLCSIEMNYVFASSTLKLNLVQFFRHEFWLGLEGSLMYLFQESNQTPITEESLVGFHGTLGPALGVNFLFGDFVVPISIRTGLYIPPTATVLTGTVGFQLGLAYRF